MDLIEINEDNYSPIEPAEWEEGVLQLIAKQRNLSIRHVVLFLQYTVISFAQFALITGQKESNIRNLVTRKEKKKAGEFISTLTECNPFPNAGSGTHFILVDDKCRAYILRSINLPSHG